MKRSILALSIMSIAFASQNAFATVAVTTSTDATAMASSLGGSGVTISGATLVGAATQQGFFTGGCRLG